MALHIRRDVFFILVFLVIAAWIILVHVVGAEAFIDKVGVRNVYIIVFLAAFWGGASSFSSGSYFVFLASLAAGGLNPFILGILGGAGLTLSDPLFFYFGVHGRNLVSRHGKMKRVIVRLAEWIKKKPKWVVPLFIFLYAGFTPLPSDLLSVSLALVRYPFRKFILFIFLANVNFAIMISLVSHFLVHAL